MFQSSRGLDNNSQAFLNKIRHQDLWSLLILHQNVMRGGDLVSFEAIQQCNTDHSGWRKTLDRYIHIYHDLYLTVLVLIMHIMYSLSSVFHWCFWLQGCILLHRWPTFEATDTAHGSKHCGLHFNVPHSSLIRFPQILQFFFMREGTESSIQSALTYRDPSFATSRPPCVNNISVMHLRQSYLHRSHVCTWCYRSRRGSYRGQRSTAEAHWRPPHPAQCFWWWLFPAPPARIGDGRNSPLLCPW